MENNLRTIAIPLKPDHTRHYRSSTLSFLSPRIWKILIATAYPFLLVTANYFEALERTGSLGAFIADTLLPVTLISYVGLIIVLRKRAL